jgi:cytochrome P450
MIKAQPFDIISPAFHANPFLTLERMRTERPVIRMKLPIVGRTWLAVTHDGCATLLKDHGNFARDPANAGSRTRQRILRCLPRTISVLALNISARTILSIAACAALLTKRSSAAPSQP